MERLKGKRGVKREQTTRLISEASAGLETADLATVTAWRERISTCNQTLRSLNAEIEDQVPLEDLVAEYTTVSEYDDDATRVLALLGCKIASLRQKELPTPAPLNETTSATASVPPSNRTSGVKLPKLRLLTFNGDVSDWQSFWEQFTGAVHNNDSITRSEKFHYLRTLVTGPAAAAIAGLQATEACYDDAIHILTQRFGDRRRIEQDHLAKLRSLPPVASGKDTRGLRRIYDHVQTNIRGLRGLGVGSSTYCTMMSDILLRALPKEIVLDYHRWQSGNTAYRASGTLVRDPTSSNATGQDAGRSIDSLSSARICPSPLQSTDAEGELAEILGFLRVEVESRERAGVVAERYDQPQKTRIDESRMPAAALLHASITGQCFFCGSTKHSAELCTCDLTLKLKKTKLAEGSRCFRCTMGGHRARDCHRKVSCAGCSGRHATSMCDPDWKPALRNPNRDAPLTSVQNAISERNDGPLDCEILLQTFRAWAVEGKRRGYVRAIIDGGSQRTFIREDVSRKLGLKVLGETSLRLNTFGHCSTRPQRRRLVEVRLRSQYGQEECVVEAVEVPFICKDVVRVPADHVFVRRVEEDGRRIADELLFPGVPAEEGISLLVGSDQLWRVTGDQVLRCEENQKLVAISTIFGWTFQGPVSHHSSLSGNANSMVCVLRVGPAENEDIKDVLRGFWELESIGIADRPCSKTEEHNEVLTEFNETIKKVDGRYEVGLPWKASTGNLNDNRTLALKRLGGLTKRLPRNESLARRYDNAIGSCVTAGHAERVPTDSTGTESSRSRTYYTPHQPVIRNESETTKLRVVFDASSHLPGAASHNEHLDKGPNLNADLVGILVRLRMHPIAVAADMENAFLKIGVRPQDRDALHFLWAQRDPVTESSESRVKEWRMTRVPFGTSASPFLLAATLVNHLNGVNGDLKSTAELLRKSFYVDDLPVGASTIEEAALLQDQANRILGDAGMKLRKWSPNATELQNSFDGGSTTSTPSEPKGVLGLLWRRDKDTLAVPTGKVLNFVTGRRPTTLPSKSLDRIGESTKGELSRRWRHRQKVMDSFWKRWKKEYLLQLHSAHQSTEAQVNSRKDGDVVLVHEEKAPRIQWRVGRIEGVQRGRDGHVHSCLVRLPNGTILRRPVQLLYPLELAT